jgi:spore coat protein H
VANQPIRLLRRTSSLSRLGRTTSPPFQRNASHQKVQSTAEVNKLPRYELTIGSKELIELERTAFSDQTHPAIFVAEGKQYTVKVRYRGAWARSWPKKPLKIFFTGGQAFQGNHCLNLNSAWRDPAFVREPLAYQVYAACGAPAPTSRMVQLSVNGEFHGLYVEVEQPDKPFLKRHNLKGASIYKANSNANRADERDLGTKNPIPLITKRKPGKPPVTAICNCSATT